MDGKARIEIEDGGKLLMLIRKSRRADKGILEDGEAKEHRPLRCRVWKRYTNVEVRCPCTPRCRAIPRLKEPIGQNGSS